MSRERVRNVTLCAAGAMLVMSGCGVAQKVERSVSGRDNEETTAASTSGTRDMSQWMGGMCGSIRSVETAANQRDQAEVSDILNNGKAKELAAHVRVVEQEVSKAAENLEQSGPPPVEGGDKVYGELKEKFAERKEALEKSAQFIDDATSRPDPVAPVQIVRASQSAYKAAPILGHQLERHSEIRAAFDSNPSCKGLAGNGDEEETS